MEVVGITALSGIVQGLLKTLTTLLLDDFFKGRGKDETIPGRLKSTLLSIDAVLIDAEEKQIKIEAVKNWVGEVRDTVYLAEDALDDITTEALRRKETTNWSLPSFSKSKLKKVTETLQTLYEQKTGLGLKVETKMSDIRRSETTSIIGKQVLGRQTEKETIMGHLMADTEDNNKISVLAIVGIGGIGKTALAQLLYNQEGFDLKNHFTKVWIHVSEEDNVLSLTKTVYKSFTSSPLHFANFDQLQRSLEKWLGENKILLVLDDMWLETFKEWDLLWKPFASAAKGSRIIVTTRSHRVARNMRAGHTHILQPLPSDDCWMLFKEHAHGDQKQDPQQFEIFKEEVLLKCKGLPLAAEAFGGLLRYNREAEWRRILKCKIWNAPTNSTEILPVLRVSYRYLPPHLKRCFAYCSIFPKGYAFDRKRVLLLWMAEGLLEKEESTEGLLQKEKNTEGMEKVGDGYFEELVSRSLFQRDRTNTTKFTMHDLVNELAQFAAGEFCFKYENEIQGITAKTRHLSYLRNQYSGEAGKFKELSDAKYLRTFLPLSIIENARNCFLDKLVSEKLLPNLTCLRVLSLSNYNIPTLPSNIFKRMKHVRYLDLSYTNLSRLPTSASHLYNLQTLLLAYCLNLIQLDEGICKLISLEYLDLTGTANLQQMPQNFGKLKRLQALTNFVVGAEKEAGAARISVLKDFTELRGKLTIVELHRVIDISEAKEANLESKTHLKEIDFTWRTSRTVANSGRNEEAIFEKLRPHNDIEEITVRKYHGQYFPAWMSDPSFSRIVCISLTECHRCTSFPSLGRLPGLKELHISNMRHLIHIGSEFFYSDPESRDQDQQPFSSLKILSFTDMPRWEEWVHVEVYGETLFPSLQEVTITNCPKLTTDLPGLFPSLISLKIYQSKRIDFQLDAHKYTELQRLTIERSCDSLVTFPLGYFSTLEELKISECRLQSFQLLDEHLPGFSALRELRISDCPDLTLLPQSLHQHQTLKLTILGCKNLVRQKKWFSV